MKHPMRHPSLRLALSAALALASGAASALGLGQIEVRSRAGQPLMAEIPVISSDPTELEFLQARLASPETFARIGLEPSAGAAADLQFEIGTGRTGGTVIRVTTQEPVNEPLLTFLVEVDWGQGRLVREYSALVDAPNAVAASTQPTIQAPLSAPSDTIDRPSESADPSGAADASQPGSATAAADAMQSQGASEHVPVRRGDTLSKVAARIGRTRDHTLDQAMIALLRANPDAFVGDDINQLRQGAVLRVPLASEVAAIDASQAAQVVRDRMRQWRQARREAVASAQAAANAAGAPSTAAGSRLPARAATSSVTAPTRADARLEIAPPAASRANRAGTQSGLEAGGEGQMLRQELQESREALAAREAELQELKTRVAELEKLRTDQQRLMALKDSELAAAQQRLATTQATAPPKPAQDAARDSGVPWMLGGAALLAALLGGWWMRRRSPAAPRFRAPPSASRSDLASAFPLRDASGPDEDLLVVQPVPADDGSVPAPIVSSHAVPAARGQAAETQAPGPMRPSETVVPRNAFDGTASPGIAAAPLTPDAPARLVTPVSPASPAHADSTDRHVAAGDEDPVTAISHTLRPVAPPPLVDAPAPATSVNERIELAQAYLELGDNDSARQLLGEVAVNGDHASRQQAIRLLRDLDSP